ncbi:EipB family protein [Magnetovibrio sp.]|uniref:EipB family protein n=1 Tax=Magnetovibrio sp. TaxID=2024836 RepID=UPI002F92D0B8
MSRLLKGAFVCASSALAIVVFAGAVQAADLVSYRAVYDVRLADAKRGSNVSAASGQIAYGVKQTCDGWLVNQTGTMYLQTATGDVVPQGLNFSSWESVDGTRYRFSVMGDETDSDIILGAASMSKTPNGGEAQFSKPEPATFALPAGTLFPMEHTVHILDQAALGKSQFENSVFEGTDVEGEKLLVSFVSPLSARAQTMAARFKDAALTHPGWNFRLAYFDPASQTGEPLYEIEADYLDNGIPVRWMLDYGDFTVEMGMTKVEILPKPDC